MKKLIFFKVFEKILEKYFKSITSIFCLKFNVHLTKCHRHIKATILITYHSKMNSVRQELELEVSPTLKRNSLGFTIDAGAHGCSML